MPTPDMRNVIPLHGAHRPAGESVRELPIFLTPEELATMFKLPSVETVYQWRRKRTGPPGTRVGRHVRYELAAVLAWARQGGQQIA